MRKSRAARRLLLFVAVLVLVDFGMRHYAQQNFITYRRVDAAIAAGDGCMVFSGGSDMLAALDLPIVARHFGEGRAPCFADMALGGTSPDVRFMAFREYLAAGRKPSALVVGFRGHDVMDERDLAPGYHIGNDASVYAWGRFADFPTYYPQLSFAAVDNGFRFLFYRLTAIGAHRQSLWIRLDLLAQQLGVKPKQATNALGNVQAFLEIEAETSAAARATHMGRDAAQLRFATWSALLVSTAREAGVRRISFVRLPATAMLERAFFPDTVGERAFSEFMVRAAREHGGEYIDLSHEPWVEDSLIVDGLHYSRRGAELISEALGRALGGG